MRLSLEISGFESFSLTSPVVDVSACAARRGPSKFPLHFDLVYFGGEFQPEFVEQDLLVIRWLADAAFSDFDSLSGGEDDVHQSDLAQLGQYPSGFMT